MAKIVVVDLGTGNLRSVGKAVEHVATDSQVTISRNIAQLKQADKLVLPGQGAIGSWLSALDNAALKTAIVDALINKPVLAICVGLQALFEENEEDGGHQGLGVFKGRIIRFASGRCDDKGLPMKVPQMGWNQVFQTQAHPLWQGIADGSWFYFLHSYHASAVDTAQVYGKTNYGLDYPSAVAKDNVFAIQCHPEKSHYVGLKLIENFVNWKI